MKVLELKTRKIIEVNASYAARLFEQGLAIFAPHEAPPSDKAAHENATRKQEIIPRKKR